MEDFPKLSTEQIIQNITLGTYQLKQAYSYLAEHIKNGKFEILVNKEFVQVENGKILYKQIQSRHKGRIKYKCYIKYVPLKDGPSGIESWYCSCLCGNRTVGCCSHISSLIYYFSCGKFLNNIPDPAGELSNFFTTVICESTDK